MQVDALWNVKDYAGAAVAMAKNPKSFAEDVLKFVEINQINALTVYLQTRLSVRISIHPPYEDKPLKPPAPEPTSHVDLS